MAQLGKFLYRPDWPFHRAVNADAEGCDILGAALVNIRELHVPELTITIKNREKHPLIGLGSTRVRMFGQEARWKRMDEIEVGDHVLLPEFRGRILTLTWGEVKRKQRTAALHAIWEGTPDVAATLRLRGGRSFGTPAGFCLSRDDAR